MAAPLDALRESYDSWMAQRDPRVASWPLLASPVPTVALSTGYLVAVWLGQLVMANRKPFELRTTMRLYNVFTVGFNLYILVGLLRSAVAQNSKSTFNTICAPVDYSNDADALSMAWFIYLHYVSKMLEFVDTVLMVCRKKTGQVTFLHLFHHSTMFPIWWIGANWVPGGNSAVGASINSFVHVIMYSYYLFASFGESLRGWLWWKRYLTTLQIAQFFVVFAHAVYAMREVAAGRCRFPLWMGFANVAYMVAMIALFGVFYSRAYGRKKRSKAAKAE